MFALPIKAELEGAFPKLPAQILDSGALATSDSRAHYKGKGRKKHNPRDSNYFVKS